MKINARILSLSFAAALLASVSAHAAGGATPADGTTLIGLGGQVATAGVAGGMADPVPLFAGANGPAIFVMNVPSATGTGSKTGTKLTKPMTKGFEPSVPQTLSGPRY